MTLSAMKRLAVHKMSIDMVPPGSGGSLGESVARVVRQVQDRERFTSLARDAEQWAWKAVEAVRNAAEPNPWRNASDEEIAAELVRQIEERKK